MGSFSLTHWLIVLAIVLIVFGAGRLPRTMGELARGVRAFRSGIRNDAGSETAGEQQPVESQPPSAAGDR